MESDHGFASGPESPTDAQLAAIVSLAADAIISVDEEQRITAFNQGAERIFGYAADEVIGRPLDVLLPERFGAAHRRHLKEFAASEDRARRMGERLEIAGLRKSGEEFPADASITKLRTDGGWHFLAILRDLTTQREAEERALRLAGAEAAQREAVRLASRLEKLQKLTATLSQARTVSEVAEVTVGRGLRVLEADRGALGILSDDGGEVEVLGTLGYPTFLVDRFRRIPMDAPIPPLDALRTGEPLWIRSPEEYRERYPEAFAEFHEQTGTKAMAALPLEAKEGLIGALLVGFDSSEALGVVDEAFTVVVAQETAVALARAHAYQREREGRLEAEGLARAREETLAAVAHDLRSPLQTIENYLRLLEQEPGPESRAQAIDTIGRGIAQMDRLVRDLLDAARIEAGTFQVEPLELPLGPLIRETVELYRVRAEEGGIRLEAFVPEDGPYVRADPDRLVQVLDNLLTNALKFCGRDCRVTVEARASGDGLVVGVRDTGPGIPAEEQAHLFERYWQGRLARGHSAGLGLPIAKAIVEAHGGRIWIDSEEGEGTAVWFTLPAAERRVGVEA